MDKKEKMTLKKMVFLSLATTSLFANANSNNTLDFKQEIVCKSAYAGLPEEFIKFTTLDFDGRMALKEKMCQQNKTEDFSSVIAELLYKKNPTSFTLTNYNKCWEIVRNGRPLDSLNPDKHSVLEITGICGFKRLHAFLQFYQEKENLQKSFWEGKDKYYVSAFMAEEKAFNDVLELYDFKTRSEVWQNFHLKIAQYLIKNKEPALKDLYWKNLKKQIKSNLVCQQRNSTKMR